MPKQICTNYFFSASIISCFEWLQVLKAVEDLYLKKRTRMRRWICCGEKRGDSDLSNEEVHLKSPWQQSDGMLQTRVHFTYLYFLSMYGSDLMIY